MDCISDFKLGVGGRLFGRISWGGLLLCFNRFFWGGSLVLFIFFFLMCILGRVSYFTVR